MRNPNKIIIKDKSHCCGCEACVQRCPRHCITLQVDREGFHYPHIDASQCIECGICQRVCPHHNPAPARQPLATYAAHHLTDAIRLTSSSGGIFSALAEHTIRQGGVVFGVVWGTDWQPTYHHTDSLDDLPRFRGSKYPQARVGTAYAAVEEHLKSGRQVLFTGTPCQVRGLHLYLRRTYPNLLCADVICHGVPSPGVFQRHLSEELTSIASAHHLHPAQLRVTDIQFRNKTTGWHNLSSTYHFADTQGNTYTQTTLASDNPYMQGYLRDIYLRPSCYACPVKSCRSGSDITLGDYWGIEQLRPDLDDPRGISAVLLHTPAGEQAFHSLPVAKHPMHYAGIQVHNSKVHQSARKPLCRARFFRSRQPFRAAIQQTSQPTLIEKYTFIIKNFIRRICE